MHCSLERAFGASDGARMSIVSMVYWADVQGEGSLEAAMAGSASILGLARGQGSRSNIKSKTREHGKKSSPKVLRSTRE
jgi:hypothetical protein